MLEEDENAGAGHYLGVSREPIVCLLVGTSGAVMLVAGATNVAAARAIAQRRPGRRQQRLRPAVSGAGLWHARRLTAGCRWDDEGVTNRHLTAIVAARLSACSAPAPRRALPFAMLAFALAGVGNGLFLRHRARADAAPDP